MNSEQEKELIAYLGSIGFEGEKLQADLLQNIKLNAPGFILKHDIVYNPDRMFFDLVFKKDQYFDAYRLEKYKATYQEPVDITPQVINGIDTAKLEERMQRQDWRSYFNKELPSDPITQAYIKETLDRLGKLSGRRDQEGLDVQEKLMYKYWPADAYDASRYDLKNVYERDSYFVAGEYGICNANLAYNILSGKLDDLHESLRSMNLDQFSKKDLYRELERILSGDPDSFELKFSRNDPEGMIDLVIPVNKPDGWWYNVETFSAILTPYPPIEHGTYNGIDTQQLEDQMREINWQDERKLFIYHDDREPTFSPNVDEVQEQIYHLSKDLVGGDIADQLMLKYWVRVSFFEDVIQQTAWDHLSELPQRMQEFSVEVDAKAAYNLLCGRAVMENQVHHFLPENDNWVRLNLNEKREGGSYPEMQINGFSKAELECVLNIFPIPNSNYYPIKNSLTRGDLVPVTLTNDKKIVMEANPEQHIVNVYTPDMRVIPMNIHLDPDWRPQQQQNSNLQADKKTQATNKYPHPKTLRKNKGKGL